MLKNLSLILILALLVLALNSFYNQRKVVLASEYEMECKTIIPIGHTIDIVQESVELTVENLNIILREKEEQINQVQEMIALANQCGPNECSTGCRRRREVVPIEWICDRDQSTYNSLTDCRYACGIDGTCVVGRQQTNYYCEIEPCAGNACDFSGIASAQNQIKENYDKINEAQENIENTVKKVFQEKSIENELPTITELLTISEAGLKYCAGFVKITEEMTKEEIERLMERREIAMLLKCELAQSVQPGTRCHFNDFFCCR